MEDINFCPYTVLGFGTASERLELTDKAIKTAYRKLALKYHPDRNPEESAREMFEKIKLASEVLLNADLRRKFDQLELAKREQAQRVAQSDQARQQYVRDLLKREQEYQDMLKEQINKARAKTSASQDKAAKPLSEVDEIIKEIKKREKAENKIAKDRFETKAALFEQTQAVYKLIETGNTKHSRLTRDLVSSDLRQYGTIQSVDLHPSGKKALVTFVYRDSLLKALHQTTANSYDSHFKLKKASDKDLAKNEQRQSKQESTIVKMKRKFKVSGLTYRQGTGYGAQHETLESLERKVMQLIANQKPSVQI